MRFTIVCRLTCVSILICASMMSVGVTQENIRNPRDRKKLFEALDRDGDQRLSRAEINNNPLFARLDINNDGFVTLDEAKSSLQPNSNPTRNRGNADSRPVFPPNAAAVFAKQKQLESIPDVVRSGKRPPNIVLILADDLGYSDVGLYGSKAIPTPNVDDLGKQGVKFTQAYVTAASCSPSRAGLLTGCYQQRFGFEFNTAGGAITHRLHRGLDPRAVTIADILQQAGYQTGMFGKWHLGTQPHLHPQERGFDEFYGFLAGAHSFLPVKEQEPIHSTIMKGQKPLMEPCYLTDAIARETVEFIKKYQNQPFFAYVPFNAVHTPIEATKKYQDRFAGEQEPKRRDYYAMTSALDDAVGTIVKSLVDHQLYDNSLIIFLNDNGGPTYTGVQDNGPFRLGKLFLFEGGIRVPMIIKWPKQESSGQQFARPVSALDVLPTICDVAGVELNDDFQLDGVGLGPFVKGERPGDPHRSLFWSNGPNNAVLKGDWKLVRSGSNQWLFNLDSDPGESNNFAPSNPEEVQELIKEFEEWRSDMKSPAWPSKPRRRKVDVDGMIYELNI